jgi:hypothetical protein
VLVTGALAGLVAAAAVRPGTVRRA